jgi:hypothetical protein
MRINHKENSYGITFVRQAELISLEASRVLEISYFYSNGDLNSTPKITTVIPKITQ